MGKIAIVTGGNKGIGYETVRGLVKSGQFEKVYLTARNNKLGEGRVRNFFFRKNRTININIENYINEEKNQSFFRIRKSGKRSPRPRRED